MTATTRAGNPATSTVEVTVDGRPISRNLAARLVSVRVASRLGVPTQCEVAFATGRAGAAEADVVGLGAALKVTPTSGRTPLFDGDVTCTGVEYGPSAETQLRIRAYDPLHRLRKHQQLRVMTGLTARDLADILAGPARLSTATGRDGPVHPCIVQDAETDLQVLRRVAVRSGLYPVVSDGALRLVGLDGFGEPVALALGETLHEASFDANLDGARAEITALGWDPVAAVALRARATDHGHGTRVGARPSPADVGADGLGFLVDQPGATAEEVAALAQAELDRRGAATVALRGVAAGDARLCAGGRVTVQGVAEAFEGTYVLTEAVHTVDATGYLTFVSSEPPPVEDAAVRGASLTLGTVSDVADPDGLGRVRVRLSARGDADVGWLGVLCAGAGAGRGIVALPDTGDTVLVALPHGPESGFVLGSLFGTAQPHDSGVDGGSVKRWSLHTAGGQAIVADDGKSSITVTNRSGSTLRLAPGRVTLHAATHLDIDAPGKTITIRANAVEFEHAPGSPAGGGP